MCGLKVSIKGNLPEKAGAVIKEYNLIEPGDEVISALSGGADSVALLFVLYSLSEKIGFTLRAAHLNHMIRGAEAERDEEFAVKTAEKLGIECVVKRCDIPRLSVGRNMEETAREERYRFFSELSEERGKIAVAHNLNDLAETVIMRIARGTSVSGLSGIRVKNNNIIRPLLFTPRSEIEAFLSENKISYVTDSTNLSDDYTRNKIRHAILPQFISLNGNFLSSVKRTAKKAKDAADFIAVSAKEAYGDISGSIDIEKARHLHNALKEYIISKSAYAAGMKEISDKNISDIKKLFDLPSGKKIQLSGMYEALRIYDKIKISKREENKNYNYELKIGNNYIVEAGYTVTVERSKKGIDLAKVTLPLYARPKKEGDSFYPAGMGGEKKLKMLFSDLKFPVDKRGKYPIITDSEKIVFALGRADERAVSGETTENAITIKITEGELR